MNELWRRVEVQEGRPVFRGTGGPTSDILEPLERGESASALVRERGLEPADVVAALAHAALGEDETDGLPLTQGKPRRPRLARAITEESLTELFPGLSRQARLALAAGLFQILDLWDESHEAAQSAEDLGERAVSAYWHGIAHRREPDPGNASYWFRRVGRHPVFPGLAGVVQDLIGKDRSLADRLTPRGDWDPFAFIAWTGSPGKSEPMARSIQRVEMILLLEASLPS